MPPVTVTITKATTSVELTTREALWLAERLDGESGGPDLAARIREALGASGAPAEVAIEEDDVRLVGRLLDEHENETTGQLRQLRAEMDRWL